MFGHLLVPLDGSRLAETALPAAAELARRLRASVTLLHVLEPDAPPTVHGDRHLRSPAEAEGYLAGTADWMAARQVSADVALNQQQGDVAATIARIGGAVGADLIVLTTHGRSGVRGLLFGRVAQQVLQRGAIPVLLIQPSASGRDAAFAFRRLLVPLDGSDTSERALPAAAALAAAYGAELGLMRVVPTVDTVSGDQSAPARLLPTTTAAMLEVEAAEAGSYLERIAGGMRQEGRVVATAVGRGDPVRVLADAVRQRQVDLMVMATHGRSGVSAVWAGSVASRLIGTGVTPVLLVRIPPQDEKTPDVLRPSAPPA